MASTQVNGPDWLTSSYLQSILQTALEEPQLVIHDVTITPASGAGDGNCSEMLRIQLDMDTSAGKHQKLSIIGKLKPSSSVLDDLANANDVFATETKFFTILQKRLNKILERFGIDAKTSPKCYYVDTKNPIIFMEDLKAENMQMSPKNKFLNLKEAELFLEALAVFHATTYQAVQEDPELKKIFEKNFWNGGEVLLFDKMEENTAKAFQKYGHLYNISEEWKKKLRDFKAKPTNENKEIFLPREGGFNVITHGDCWLKNALFKYKDNIAEKVIILDYQVVSYNSFAMDLHHFFFTSVEADIIINQFEHLLHVYHNRLIQVNHNLKFFGYEQMREEFLERIYRGYSVAMEIRPFVNSKDIIDLTKLIDGTHDEAIGYTDDPYITDMEKILPFFETLNFLP